MIKILSFVLAINFLIACDIKGSKVYEKEVIDNINDPIRGFTPTLSSEEFDVAKSACQALFHKITKLRTVLLGTDFLFNITENSCPPEINKRGDAILRLVLTEQVMKFNLVSNYDGSYIREVYTSQEGDLKYFCPSILNGESSRTTHDIGFNQRVALKVKGSVSEPELSLLYLIKRSENNYSLERKINFKIDVSDSNYEGNILNLEIDTLCLDRINYSKINQVFIP